MTKSEAARVLGISRRTVIRYANENAVSEDSRGRVFLEEVRKKWRSPTLRKDKNNRLRPMRGQRCNRTPDAYRKLTDGISSYAVELAQTDIRKLEKDARAIGKISRGARRAYALSVIRERAKRRYATEAINAMSQWTDRQIQAAIDTDPNLVFKQSKEYQGMIRGYRVLIEKNAKRTAQSANV